MSLGFETQEPLHGRSMGALKLSPISDGNRVLAYRPVREEVTGVGARVRTVEDSEFPGIKHVELYEAPFDATYHLPPLEEVIESTEKPPIRFLISRLGGLAVVTSQFGYQSTGHVVAEGSRLWYSKPPVRMITLSDFAAGRELREAHLLRLDVERCDPSKELSRVDADNIFRFMLSDVAESANEVN